MVHAHLSGLLYVNGGCEGPRSSVSMSKSGCHPSDVNRHDKWSSGHVWRLFERVHHIFCSDFLYVLAGQDTTRAQWMVEATQRVSVTTIQQLLSNSSSRTSTTMRTDISGSVHVEGTRPPSKKSCRNGPSCTHLLKGNCAYVHSEEEIVAAEAAR